ncbi:hypothetical protein [Cellulomonas sp. SG140]|nr:hypothetical protein [Cellulomonas sp. SG140]
MTDDEAVAYWAERFKENPPKPPSPAKLVALRNLLGPIDLTRTAPAAKAA